MIKITFKLGGDVIEAIIRGNYLFFYDTSSHTQAPIEGLKLSKSGVIKEFPDLKDNKDWKKEAIKRFKEHFKKIGSELEKALYVKSELEKNGYEALFWMRAGFRPQKPDKLYSQLKQRKENNEK